MGELEDVLNKYPETSPLMFWHNNSGEIDCSFCEGNSKETKEGVPNCENCGYNLPREKVKKD